MSTLVAPVPNSATAAELRPWMHNPVITVNINAPLSDAVQLMHDHAVRRLPVVDDEGKLCGILTTGDARGADVMRAHSGDVFEIAAAMRNIKVGEVMTERPLVVTASTTLCEAARLMRDYKIGGLPVVDNEHSVVGIITETDLLSVLISLLECPETEA